MGPKPAAAETDDLFVSRLDELINMRHPLVRLAGLIDWAEIERTFSPTPVPAAADPHCLLARSPR